MNPDIYLQRKFERNFPKGGPSGCYGTYIQLTKKLGVKVIGCGSIHRNVVIEEDMKHTAKEAKTAKKVRRIYKNTPKCYGIRMFKAKERYYACILYQHLGKIRVYDIKDWDRAEMATENMREQLKKRNIYMDDLHKKNIMFFKGKFWLIDMGQVWFRTI